MYIDIGIAVIVVIFALLGLLSGFWGQILRLAALVSLFFLAPPVARAIQGPVGDTLGTTASPQMIWGTALIVAAVLLYIGMSLLIAIILHSAKAYKNMSGTNRVAGMLLGLVKGLVLTYLLACGFAMVGQAGHLSGVVEQQSSESRVVKLVAKYNIIEKMGYSLEEIVTTVTSLGQQGEAGTGEGTQPVQPAVPASAQPPGPMVPSTMPMVPSTTMPLVPASQPGQMVPILPPGQGLQPVPTQGFPNQGLQPLPPQVPSTQGAWPTPVQPGQGVIITPPPYVPATTWPQPQPVGP